MGFTEVLTIVFIVLKLIGVINWSWFFVLLPEIIAFVLYAIIFIILWFDRYNFNKFMKNIMKDW